MGGYIERGSVAIFCGQMSMLEISDLKFLWQSDIRGSKRVGKYCATRESLM